MLLKYFLIFLLVFSLPGFGQEEKELEPINEGGGTVTIRHDPTIEENAQDPNAGQVGVISMPEEDEALKELEAAREKQLEKARMLDAATKPLARPMGANPMQQLQQLGANQINPMTLMDDKVQALIQKMLADGLLSQNPPEFYRTMITQKVKGTFFEKVFNRFPGLLEICIEVIRDREAFPGLVKIFGKKDDLKTYGYIWLAIFVFGLFIRKRLIKPEWPFFKRMRYSLTISLFLTCTSLYIFYTIFEAEVGPTLRIIGKHL